MQLSKFFLASMASLTLSLSPILAQNAFAQAVEGAVGGAAAGGGILSSIGGAIASNPALALGATAALGKVWELGATLTLTAGQSTTLIARPSDPFTGAVSPVLGTDYVLTAGTAGVTLTYTSGFVAFIDAATGAIEFESSIPAITTSASAR